ncbi:MAG: hypothetical protein AAFV62_07030 [Pseudomonadota bacterium]
MLPNGSDPEDTIAEALELVIVLTILNLIAVGIAALICHVFDCEIGPEAFALAHIPLLTAFFIVRPIEAILEEGRALLTVALSGSAWFLMLTAASAILYWLGSQIAVPLGLALSLGLVAAIETFRSLDPDLST